MSRVTQDRAPVSRVHARSRAVGRSWLRGGQLFVTYAVLLAGAVILMIPFAWQVSTSLKPADQIYIWPVIWIPEPIMWENYPRTFNAAPFALWTVNTVKIVVFNIIGNLISCSLVAYSFAKLRYPGRNTLFLIMLSTLMVPGWVTIIPTFILFRTLGWVDTFAPLIVPGFFGVPFYIFLLRQFFLGIPNDLEDSARIDGCSTLGIIGRVVLPLAKPALATVAIFSFMSHWNEFLQPLIYLRSAENYTIAIGLRGFQTDVLSGGSIASSGRVEVHYLMAASVMALIPPVILFFLAQRLFIQGVVITGVEK